MNVCQGLCRCRLLWSQKEVSRCPCMWVFGGSDVSRSMQSWTFLTTLLSSNPRSLTSVQSNKLLLCLPTLPVHVAVLLFAQATALSSFFYSPVSSHSKFVVRLRAIVSPHNHLHSFFFLDVCMLQGGRT
jgi:hypothetical protein